jgi:hypothetical protein
MFTLGFERQLKLEDERKLVRGLYDYAAASDDELSFSEGDYLMRKDDESKSGWWLCEFRGRTGYVPSNYVEVDASVAPVSLLLLTVN